MACHSLTCLPATRAKAIAAGVTRYFTGKPCKYGHVGERTVSRRCCVSCLRVAIDTWKARNPDRVRASGRGSSTRWRKANPETARASFKAWRGKNLEQQRQRVREYLRAVPGRRNAYRARRRADERRQTPPWANQAAIRAIYRAASELTAQTGVEYHVDHVIPLRGRKVSGLHIESNLSCIPKAENMAKSNRFDGHLLPAAREAEVAAAV